MTATTLVTAAYTRSPWATSRCACVAEGPALGSLRRAAPARARFGTTNSVRRIASIRTSGRFSYNASFRSAGRSPFDLADPATARTAAEARLIHRQISPSSPERRQRVRLRRNVPAHDEERAVDAGKGESAGMNRHGGEDGRALRRRVGREWRHPRSPRGPTVEDRRRPRAAASCHTGRAAALVRRWGPNGSMGGCHTRLHRRPTGRASKIGLGPGQPKRLRFR
jgi:hypothetical protein